MESANHTNWPWELAEALFSDDVEYDRYVKVVNKYQDITQLTISPGVKADIATMLQKMQTLLLLKIQLEMDYPKAAKNCSNIIHNWTNIEFAGTNAFIPNINK